MKQTKVVSQQHDCAYPSRPHLRLSQNGATGGPERPLVLVTEPWASHFDCDCACNLNLPSVLAERVAQLFDCDCACALDVPQTPAIQATSASFDCDCACALDLCQEVPALSAATPWVKQSQAVSFPLQDEWRAYLNPRGPVGLAVLNAGADRVLATFDAPIPIAEATECLPGLSPSVFRETVEGLAGSGLLCPASMESRPFMQPMVLSAWLTVTEACNLNCPYCYVHKRPKVMSRKVGRLAVDKLIEAAVRNGYSSLKLKYAGGEPTLAFPLIQAIHAHAAQRCTKAGLTLEEVILTNGVGVTDKVLDFVAQAGMRLMVSLDGGPEAHDRVRCRRDGGSTHASVMSTVERARERGLRPSISVTLTDLSLDGAGEAVLFALERDLPFNLNFYRECSSPDPGAKPSPLTPDPGRLLEALRGVFELVGSYPAYPLALGAILDRTRLDVPHSHTCSAGRDYLVVDSQGGVSACQMLLEEPWADLADDDPLQTIRQRGADVFASPEEQGECSTCPWRMACSGGCPLMRDTTLHDDYCWVYRTLLPELVRLEAKRLIALQSGS